MKYWLIKSEPDTWSWDAQVAKGVEEWDGVRNATARLNMRAMAVGDRAFFYHSGKERRIVGIVRVAALAHPDSTDATGKWECVDFETVCQMTRPVTLTDIKAVPELRDIQLVRMSRLSVQSVPEDAWRRICAMGATDPDAP